MVSWTNLSKTERADLKRRAAAGDEMAADRLRVVRANEVKKSQRYVERQKLKANSRNQNNMELSEDKIKVATRRSVGSPETNEDSIATPETNVAKEVVQEREEAPAGSAKVAQPETVDLSRSDDEEDDRLEVGAGTQAISESVKDPSPAPSLKSQNRKRHASKAEIELQLERLDRKRRRIELDIARVDMEKAWLENANEEAELKLELVRAKEEEDE